jgi:outer membrane protein insertion porin family
MFPNLIRVARFIPIKMLVLCLLMAAPFSLPLQAQDGFAVQGIAFKGNKTFHPATLKLLMETKTVGWFSKLFGKRGSEYDDEVVSQDIEKIATFYQHEGFLYVKITPLLNEIDRSGKTVKLTVSIEEGRPIEVGRITTSLAPPCSLSDTVLQGILKQINGELLLRPQTRFRDSSIILDQLLLTREFSNAGYPYAEIRAELVVSKPDYTVDVTWHIESGPRCILGDLRLLGVSKVAAPVITRQMAFRREDLYQLRKIEQSQQQVYGLGIFQVATVTPNLSKDRDTIISVDVFVKDARRFTTKLGVGYGTEDHARVLSETRLLGFLGGARRLQFFIKHSYLDPYHVMVTLTQPGYPTPRATLAASPFVWRQREPAFTVNRVGGSLGVIHQFNRRLAGSITYSLEHVRVAQSALTLATDSSAILKLYNKSQIILGSSFDNSFPMFNPRRGFFNINTFTLGGLGFGSKTRYTKFLIDVRRYQPLSVLVLAARIKLGGIRTFGSESFVPVEERFYSGGSSSVRGWARFDLGPHAADLPIGGLSLFEGSAEFRYPIVGILSGVVFGDLGNVWTESYYYQLSDLHYAAGVGIRVATPIGPIRLDVARPVADIEKKVQVHFSVGQAF